MYNKPTSRAQFVTVLITSQRSSDDNIQLQPTVIYPKLSPNSIASLKFPHKRADNLQAISRHFIAFVCINMITQP